MPILCSLLHILSSLVVPLVHLSTLISATFIIIHFYALFFCQPPISFRTYLLDSLEFSRRIKQPTLLSPWSTRTYPIIYILIKTSFFCTKNPKKKKTPLTFFNLKHFNYNSSSPPSLIICLFLIISQCLKKVYVTMYNAQLIYTINISYSMYVQGYTLLVGRPITEN